MNKYSVSIAAFIMYVLRFAVFIEPQPVKSTCASSAYIGGFPGLIILISTCIVLTDIQPYPLRYKQAYVKIFFIIETIICLFIIEFVMILIWTRIEENIVILIKFMLSRGNLYHEMGGDNFLEFLLSGLTFSVLLYSINATRSSESIMATLNLIKKEIGKIANEGKKLFSKKQDTQSISKESYQYHCLPNQAELKIIRRNPHCPLHGDKEVNQ